MPKLKINQLLSLFFLHQGSVLRTSLTQLAGFDC